MATLSIDLGTYNICSVFSSHGNEQLVVEHNGNHIIPSCICYSDDGSVNCVGSSAYRRYWESKNTIRCVKRVMGLDMDSDDMRDYMNNCLASIDSGIDGKAVFSIPAYPEKNLTPTMVCTDMLKYIADLAKEQFHETISTLIVTIPAYFTQQQRLEMKKATIDALICRTVHIVSEPVAACFKYNVIDIMNESTFMVVDFGAGTLDTCIMRAKGNTSEVVITDGDRHLGGDDITNALVSFCEDVYFKQKGEKLIKIPQKSCFYRSKREALKSIVEIAKKQLSFAFETTINIASVSYIRSCKRSMASDSDSSDDEDEIIISREQLDNLIAPIIARVKNVIERTIERSEVDINNIDRVIAVGGSCRLMAVNNLLHTLFGDKSYVIADPDECVARGASLCLNMSILSKTHFLVDRLPDAYGTVVYNDEKHRDEFSAIIPKGAKFPEDKIYSKQFYQVELNSGLLASWADVDIYYSSDGEWNNYKLMIPFSLTDLSTARDNIITVKYNIDNDGIIYVEVVQSTDNKTVFMKKALGEVLGVKNG